MTKQAKVFDWKAISSTNLLKEGVLKKRIIALSKTLDKLDHDMHLFACSALNIYAEHGNTNTLTLLAYTLGKYKGEGAWDGRAVRGTAYREWVLRHAPSLEWKVKKNSKGEQDDGFTKKEGEDGKLKTRMDAAIIKPFFADAETAKVPEIPMAAKMFEQLLSKFMRDADKFKEDGLEELYADRVKAAIEMATFMENSEQYPAWSEDINKKINKFEESHDVKLRIVPSVITESVLSKAS